VSVSIDNIEAVRRWAPILRGLLAARDGRLPAISFEPAASVASEKRLEIPLGSDADDKALCARIRAAIEQYGRLPELVDVSGLGLFSVQRPLRGAGRVAGKLALVTGGAQGFGYEIASHLGKEGARVALADINLEGAQASAAKLNEIYGEERATAVQINVADADSVRAAFDSLIVAWGGLDLLVANAGVLRAGGLDKLTEKEFDFVTQVNYKGYYLSVRAAAPVLALQHLARPEYMSDIVQINSKSGLEGSNRNFAYAGGKFGGIGLTQSFALELVESGIKVNSICPGNFFDGPLWSDPKNGLFVQYLHSNKVPGAKTIEDVKKFYEAKVPMGRGCTGPDVMKAIYYLVEQQYETGQAVPVTGGQVMLN
jgi:sorbitol-6-phosphate 2-dehydrogenase